MKRKWGAIAIMLSGILGLVLMSVALIMTCTSCHIPQEAGLLTYCNKVPDYCKTTNCDGDCEERLPMLWDKSRIPLRVAIADTPGYKLTGLDVRSLHYAIREVNRELGFDMLEEDHDFIYRYKTLNVPGLIATLIRLKRDPPEIHVEFGYSSTSGALGLCTHYKAPNSKQIGFVHIVMAGGLEYNSQYIVSLHELGHALGLAHDSRHDSIMYPTVDVDRMVFADKIRYQSFTDHDRRILRELYGPRRR